MILLWVIAIVVPLLSCKIEFRVSVKDRVLCKSGPTNFEGEFKKQKTKKDFSVSEFVKSDEDVARRAYPVHK